MENPQAEDIGILKTIWKKNEAGVWAGHDLKSIYLTKGVVSRSWQDENHASGCLIASMMDLPLITEKSLLALMKDGTEGIAQFIGAGL